MNVLHHLATQLEAYVILLQETHCISAEKLVLSNYQLAGFSLSRKHGLATFVHERLKWTLYDQSPTTSETEWLCVNVDGYKILTSTNFHQRGCKFPTFQCSLTLVCMRVISTASMSTGVITPTARMETAYWAGQAPII